MKFLTFSMLVFMAGYYTSANGQIHQSRIAPTPAHDEERIAIFERVLASESSMTPRTCRPYVRLAFKHTAGAWTAYPQRTIDLTPAKIKSLDQNAADSTTLWQATYRGQKVGSIKTGRMLDPGKLWYGRKPGAPKIGWLLNVLKWDIRKNEIPGFDEEACQYTWSTGTQVKRPIVLVTGNPYQNPEDWKPAAVKAVPDDISNTLLVHLKRLYREEIDWLNKQGTDIHAVTVSPVDQYAKADLAIDQAWQSENGDFLYGLKFKKDTTILTLDSDPLRHDFYVLQRVGNQPALLGAPMELVDLADYDGDGKTEFLFWMTRENRDGYLLFWGNPIRTAEATWSYH